MRTRPVSSCPGTALRTPARGILRASRNKVGHPRPDGGRENAMVHVIGAGGVVRRRRGNVIRPIIRDVTAVAVHHGSKEAERRSGLLPLSGEITAKSTVIME